MNNLPTTFWAQLFARFTESQPKFYQIILKNSIWLTAIAFVIPYITTDILPGIGVEVPQWLTFLNAEFIKWRTILMGAGIGSALVAKTTLNTTGTPPLVTDEKKPEDMEATIRRIMQEEISKNRTGL